MKPSRLPVGGTVTFSSVLANQGPSVASGVTVTDRLPRSFTVRSTHSYRGACHVKHQTVACRLGQMDLFGRATVTIRAVVRKAGRFTNRTAVTSATSDPNATNNRTTAHVKVGSGCDSGPEEPARGKATATRSLPASFLERSTLLAVHASATLGAGR